MDMETDIAAIREVLKQYAMSVSNDDFGSWISLWADDGTAMPPDAPVCIGKEQIRKTVKPDFDELSMKMNILSIEDTRVHGDLGLTRCKYNLKVTPKTGGETIDAMPDGKALTLYQRQSDGSWKIIYDCYNSSVPEIPA
jgi:uncharacterized protein (TIGR02246 family)